MSISTDLAYAPASEIARLIRSREMTAVEAVELYLRRIEQIDPALGTFIHVAADRALAQAAAPCEGPFAGVPISVKDAQDVAGMPTTFGVAAFRDRVAEADAAVVRRLREAGFIVIGKTKLPEMGLTCTTEPLGYGPARNPWNFQRTTGGSSGGGAAATAAGLCPVALGSDGGGSLRTPAGACGVFTIKASRGRITMAPAPSSFTGTVGPITRDVADAAALLDILSGPEPGDAYRPAAPERPYSEEVGHDAGRLRIAFTDADAEGAPVAAGPRQAVREAASLLESLGHDVEEAAPPGWASRRLVDVVLVITAAWQAGMASVLPPVEELDPVTQGYIRRGRELTAAQLYEADAESQTWGRAWVPFFNDYDVLLTPQNAIPPPPLGWIIEDPEPASVLDRSWRFAPFTAQWNFTGQPAVTVPWGLDVEGLPLAVQLVGRPEDEATLLRLAAQFEGVRPWAQIRPEVVV